MRKKDKGSDLQKNEVLLARNEIIEIKSDLDNAYACFNHISDPNLVDACIYEINALNARYNCTLKDIKDRLYSQNL